MGIRVFKFGGASLKNEEGFENVCNILNEYRDQKIIVVASALGKTTNALEVVVNAGFNKQSNTLELLGSVETTHFHIARNLFKNDNRIFGTLKKTFEDAAAIINGKIADDYDFLYDQVVCFGELAATQILSALLVEKGIPVHLIDARQFIRTDNNFREGRVDWVETERLIIDKIPALLNTGIVLTQGFIAGTSENHTTTLGREGSDYTAAIIAHCIEANDVTIWKDVPGVLNADPRYFREVEKIDEISYKEAIEMAFYGATVIHPKTLKPIQNKNIPLLVKSFLSPDSAGTIIHENCNSVFHQPVLVLKPQQILISVSPKDFSFMDEKNIEHIFSLMVKNRVHFNLMQNAAISFSLCADNVPNRIEPFINDLQNHYKVLVNENLELLTIRHYSDEVLNYYLQNREIFLEQKTRQTCQLIIRSVS